jgi:prepilin-type processing-associated H-X9-DG protein
MNEKALSPRLNASGAARFTTDCGFTLLDLLAILLTVFLLASVAATGLSRTQPTGQSVQCLTNVRRLANAWQMYAQDNNDKLVIAYHGAAAMGGNFDPVIGPAWSAGWLDWTTSPDNTNTAFLVGRFSRFEPYLAGSASVFQCPSDRFVSPGQKLSGWTRRARSYSMSLGLGDGNAESGSWNPFYAHVKKMSDLRFPSPSETWVYLEEHPDSINDPAFMLPNATLWMDYPASFHNGNTSFSFADGHVESHHWKGAFSSPRGSVVRYAFDFNTVTQAGDPDIHWTSYHAQRTSSASY